MSFLSDKQRRLDLRGIPSITVRPSHDPGEPGDPVAELMGNALAVLAERGWTKVRFANRRGNLCLLGALRVADGGRARWPFDRSMFYRQAVARLNRLACDRGYSRATFFNDNPGTCYQDVVTFVQDAIRQERRPT